MESNTDTGYQIVARKLMEIILYDNGAVNRFEPDDNRKYPVSHFNRITQACESLFEAHPSLLTDENLDDIASGEYEENQAKFGAYEEYRELDKALNEFFDII
jgi:hypothetical protein